MALPKSLCPLFLKIFPFPQDNPSFYRIGFFPPNKAFSAFRLLEKNGVLVSKNESGSWVETCSENLSCVAEILEKKGGFRVVPELADIRKNFIPVEKKLNGVSPIVWEKRTVIMGILNVTPDSFSDGGKFLDPQAALDRALAMQEEGSDWVDVGGESTRPGARGVSEQEEKKRVLPVLRLLVKKLRIPVSIDTSKFAVAQAAVEEGARLINDVTGLSDMRMLQLCARKNIPAVLMHMKGRPRTMQKNPVYQDCIGEILMFFHQRLEKAREAGVPRETLLLDPGFGFGKTVAHNLELTRALSAFRVFGCPILFGASRKSTLGMVTGGLPPEERLEASLSIACLAVLSGADWLRVHDVQETVRAVKIADALRYGLREEA